MRAIFFGTPAIAVPALDSLNDIAEIVGVVCQPDRPAGRGMKLRLPPIKQRAIELENLCLLVATIASDLPLPTQGEVLVVADRLTAISSLCAVGGRAAGVVAGAPLSPDELGVKIAQAASVPVLANIEGLFAWVRPEDTLLLDCDQGLLRVNPPATTIARYRHHSSS